MKEFEKKEIQTMVRLSKIERADIEKISADNQDGHLSVTIRRLILNEIKRVKNVLEGE